ncbi:hypothetical protein GGS23DRAFT_431282 [Durotheca rogersii]|uniref:uncharacterized protein n=1 Tax=Durotheca rogersii TaxID=419775 RepID=UPI00221E5D01|nr:uncharacterized protein GGS23DRAFT_431282 [Durotheca rogersii]KAI5865520.1 hypothetical protein GGS23DRAFT_431282 [Durotheca rogersii]
MGRINAIEHVLPALATSQHFSHLCGHPSPVPTGASDGRAPLQIVVLDLACYYVQDSQANPGSLSHPQYPPCRPSSPILTREGGLLLALSVPLSSLLPPPSNQHFRRILASCFLSFLMSLLIRFHILLLLCLTRPARDNSLLMLLVFLRHLV